MSRPHFPASDADDYRNIIRRLDALERSAGGENEARLTALETAPDWIEVAVFSHSWVNYGGGFPTAGYRKIGDIVYLKGLLKNGTLNDTAFTLPVGYRPLSSSRHFITMMTAAAGGLRVITDGTVLFGQPDGGGNGYCSLDGIHFEISG